MIKDLMLPGIVSEKHDELKFLFSPANANHEPYSPTAANPRQSLNSTCASLGSLGLKHIL